MQLGRLEIAKVSQVRESEDECVRNCEKMAPLWQRVHHDKTFSTTNSRL